MNNNIICALIKKDDFILIAKRRNGKWELPTGITEGSDELKSVERELYEEYNIKVKADKLITNIEYRNNNYKLYDCTYNSGNFRLYNHIDYKWIKPKFINDYDLIQLDRELVKYI